MALAPKKLKEYWKSQNKINLLRGKLHEYYNGSL